MTGNSIQSPEKELRFTRSAQGAVFWLASACMVGVAITLAASAVHRPANPELPHPAWALVPLAIASLCAHLGQWLTRHAYLILTPLGIEIFPFFRPSKGMRMVYWHEIHDAEIDARATLLTLHHNAEKTAGIHLSLRPIPAARRTLLARAVMGRIRQRADA